MRKIGVVTGARSDYGILFPLIRSIHHDDKLELWLMVTGMHLAPEFGATVHQIEADGFPIQERVEMLLSSDSPAGISKSVGLGVLGFAEAFGRVRPDILVLMGDRFETLAAAFAALPFRIPTAHIHGGEVTQGALDDAMRHAITKFSHLHFVAAEAYARRVIQLGEAPWRVTVCGAPGLDRIEGIELLDRDAFARQYGVSVTGDTLLVTFHPVTQEAEKNTFYIEELLAALEQEDRPVVFTLANADAGGREINRQIKSYAERKPTVYVLDNLGTRGYFSVMGLAGAMVGNSSSGIIEAASFKLPVVNVGTRQEGRVRPANVIDVGYGREEIQAGIAHALRLKPSLTNLENPYGDGHAVERIVERLKTIPLNDQLTTKVFYDVH